MKDRMNTSNPGLSKYTRSFALSFAAAAVVNGLLVIGKEKSPAVMAAMKHLTGHHWISHSAIVITLFFILGWLLARSNGGSGVKLNVNSLIRILVGGTILGAAIIAGFYLFAD
jgi:hypothetical protein